MGTTGRIHGTSAVQRQEARHRIPERPGSRGPSASTHLVVFVIILFPLTVNIDPTYASRVHYSVTTCSIDTLCPSYRVTPTLASRAATCIRLALHVPLCPAPQNDSTSRIPTYDKCPPCLQQYSPSACISSPSSTIRRYLRLQAQHIRRQVPT